MKMRKDKKALCILWHMFKNRFEEANRASRNRMMRLMVLLVKLMLILAVG